MLQHLKGGNLVIFNQKWMRYLTTAHSSGSNQEKENECKHSSQQEAKVQHTFVALSKELLEKKVSGYSHISSLWFRPESVISHVWTIWFCQPFSGRSTQKLSNAKRLLWIQYCCTYQEVVGTPTVKWCGHPNSHEISKLFDLSRFGLSNTFWLFYSWQKN